MNSLKNFFHNVSNTSIPAISSVLQSNGNFTILKAYSSLSEWRCSCLDGWNKNFVPISPNLQNFNIIVFQNSLTSGFSIVKKTCLILLLTWLSQVSTVNQLFMILQNFWVRKTESYLFEHKVLCTLQRPNRLYRIYRFCERCMQKSE